MSCVASQKWLLGAACLRLHQEAYAMSARDPLKIARMLVRIGATVVGEVVWRELAGVRLCDEMLCRKTRACGAVRGSK